MQPLILTAYAENWPIAGKFVISRGAKREACVVVAEVSDGVTRGRGECAPYARYGETVDGVIAAIEAMREGLAKGMTRQALQQAMPAGAARNAIDCALWDYEAKAAGKRAAEMAGVEAPAARLTAYTISLDEPEAMARQAASVSAYPLLKLKLGGEGDAARLAAVRAAAPQARLIVDANEAWNAGSLAPLLAACEEVGVEAVEQPLPAAEDGILEGFPRRIALCADESLHDRRDLPRIAALYDAVNIKLDKAGGLTEALALAEEARARGLKIMVGCMVATSLAMAPAMLLAQKADWVDLDGPLLLARDREPGLAYSGAFVEPAPAALWG